MLDELNLAWHRLDAWPDVGPGFARLRKRFMMAPCSNGNIAIMVDIARRNDIRWDAILGSEIAGDFKPKPRVYLAAAEALNIKPNECMMTAAHSNDLKSAAENGLRTAHVGRPGENGPGTGEPAPKVPVDGAADQLHGACGQARRLAPRQAVNTPRARLDAVRAWNQRSSSAAVR